MLADEMGQSLRAAASRNDAEVYFRLTEARGFRRDPPFGTSGWRA